MSIGCGKLSGSFTRNITVTTNDPEHSSETLVCKGRLLEPARVSPHLISFGRIPGTAVLTKRALVTAMDGGPLTPELAPFEKQGVAAKLREIEAGQRYEIEVTLTPPLDPGRLRVNLTLRTGVAAAPSVNVLVVATVAPPTPADQSVPPSL